MSQPATSPAVPPTSSTSSSVDSRDFRLFFTGQLISNLGNSITDFALPLLVYQITGSQLGLGLAFAIRMLPFLLFSLPTKTQLWFLAWNAVGIIVYLAWSSRHSRLAKGEETAA